MNQGRSPASAASEAESFMASGPRRPVRSARSLAMLRAREVAITWMLRICAFSAIAGLLLIIVFVFREALPVLLDPETQKEAGLRHFFATTMWQPVGDVPKYGLAPLFLGTLKVVISAMAFAVPIGVGAAVFSSEFSPPRLRELLKPAIEVLAGIPSVVLGFFALIVMASWVQAATGATSRLNALNAGAALALGVLPTIFTVSEDALRAVPRSFREASLALGASPWQTAWHVTLPAAGAGVAAGVLLGLARAVGETMIVLMATGNTPILSFSPFNGMRTLSANIAVEIPESPVGGTLYRVLFITALLLFALTFVCNTVAEVVRQRLREKYQAV